MRKLTEKEVAALNEIYWGADVYSYSKARQLRDLEKSHGDLLLITEPQAYQGDGTDQMPYFGAVLSSKGREVVDAF